MVNNRFCLFCLKTATSNLNIPYIMDEVLIYINMIKDCFNITVPVNFLEHNISICDHCRHKLNEAFQFKKQVLQTQQDLQMIIDSTECKEELEEEYKVELLDEDCLEEEVELNPDDRQGVQQESIETIEENESKDVAGKKSLYQKYLHNIKIILDFSNATLIRRHGKIGYACFFCKNEYPLPKDLKIHNLEKHRNVTRTKFIKGQNLASLCIKLDITELKCALCSKKINTIEEILNHLFKEHRKEVYIDVKNQLVPFKFDSEVLNCCVCLNRFYSFKYLLEHMNKHYRNFICDVCDTGFINSSQLRSHKSTHIHGKFKCRICTKMFDSHKNRLGHMHRVHFRTRSFKCGYCTEKFDHQRKREKHMVEVHNLQLNKIECQACDRTFTSQSALKIHTRRIHLMEKKYKCLECEMGFFTSRSLIYHQTKHTGVKEYQCDMCLKMYGNRKILYEHMKIHANDRRFKCKHCSKAFIQKICWKGHMRAKHGEIV